MGVGKTVATNEKALASDINSMSQWGALGSRPNTEDVLAGSFYFDTDNNIMYQEQNGSWVAILQVRTLNPANETVQAGYYAATTLSAVDADLTAANIKDGITIFGFLGTFVNALAEDIVGSSGPIDTSDVATVGSVKTTPISAGGDYSCATKTQSYDAASLAVAVGFINQKNDASGELKLRLFMDGVQVAESVFFTGGNVAETIILVGTRALSGSKICLIEVHNYSGGVNNLSIASAFSATGNPVATGIGIGSVKTV